MRQIDVERIVSAAKAAAGDRLRREYTARVGRVFDQAVTAPGNNQIYVRIEGDPEAAIATFPTGFSLAGLEYDAPVIVRRKRGQWAVTGYDAAGSAAFFEGQPPASSLDYQPYIVRTASDALPNATPLSGLGTGYLKNTSGTGELSTQSTPIPVSDGGTGRATLTSGNLLVGNGTGGINSTAQASLAQGGTNANLSAANNGTVIKSGASLSVRLDNLTATTNPTTGDDAGDGYSIGSLWVNTTTDTAYLCTDATTGAAVWTAVGSSGSGTVTSVGLALPSEITVTGSPVTTTGTLTGAWASQTANRVFSAPNGSNGTPTFRALVADDIPTLTAAKISDIGEVLIGFQELASPAAVFTFPSIPATYRHLKLVLECKSDVASLGDNFLIRFNSDATASNYYTLRANISHSATLATFESLGSGNTGLNFLGALGANVTANRRGIAEILITNYAKAQQRNAQMQGWRLRGWSTGQPDLFLGGGTWLSTSAITQIDIYPLNGTNWQTNSTASLYGLG